MTDGEHGDPFGDEFADALALVNGTASTRGRSGSADRPGPSGGAPAGHAAGCAGPPPTGGAPGSGHVEEEYSATCGDARGAGSARPATRSSGHAVTPWRTARDLAERAVPGPVGPGTAELADALGRTLAAPLKALTDLPSFDTSAMDGWAVAGPGPGASTVPPTTPGPARTPASSPATPPPRCSPTATRCPSPPAPASRPAPPRCCAASTARSSNSPTAAPGCTRRVRCRPARTSAREVRSAGAVTNSCPPARW